jgi:hypothetical protein
LKKVKLASEHKMELKEDEEIIDQVTDGDESDPMTLNQNQSSILLQEERSF